MFTSIVSPWICYLIIMSADHQNWVLASLAIGHRSHRTSVGLLVLMVGTDSQHSQFQGLGCPKTCVVPLVGGQGQGLGDSVANTLSLIGRASFLFKLNLFIFSWRIVTWQYCIGFCHMSTWISHRYTYVPSLLYLPPTSQSSRLLQSPCLSFLIHRVNSHWLFALHMVVYLFPCYSLLPLLLPMSISLFSVSVSLMLPCK